ncbi:MAG: hypothetical protein ACLSVD_00895 [Eggerthellaceae bacterium]
MGEFMIVVRVCDAAVLSLSLTSLVATGLGVAALCAGHRLRIRDPAESGARRGLCARPVRRKAADRLDRLQRCCRSSPRRTRRRWRRRTAGLRRATWRSRFSCPPREEDRGGRRGRARRRGRGGGRRGRRGAAGGR